jgi:hypothetical protein
MITGITRKIEKIVIKFKDERATAEDISNFLELWKRLNPEVEEIISE